MTNIWTPLRTAAVVCSIMAISYAYVVPSKNSILCLAHFFLHCTKSSQLCMVYDVCACVLLYLVVLNMTLTDGGMRLTNFLMDCGNVASCILLLSLSTDPLTSDITNTNKYTYSVCSFHQPTFVYFSDIVNNCFQLEL